MEEDLINRFVEHFRIGGGFGTIVAARQYASQVLGVPVPAGTSAAKTLDEFIESAVIRVAREIVARGEPPGTTFEQLVDLYQRQPRLGVRSSTSMLQQAYSTPIPIAYLASILAGINQDKTVYEPTAGHGALVLGALPSQSYVNELNPERAADLRRQGFVVTEIDATAHSPPVLVDVVIANPPFGRVAGQSWTVNAGAATRPYRTTQIDHAISFQALQSLKSDGQAVLILASPLANKTGKQDAASSAYNSPQNRAFYKSLYENYRVTDHLCIAGDLYARQGTTFPIDVVVIAGRGPSQRELPAVILPQVYTQFEEIKGLIDEISRASLLLVSREPRARGINSVPYQPADPESTAVPRAFNGSVNLANPARGEQSGASSDSILDGTEQSISRELAGRNRLSLGMGGSRDRVQFRASGLSENPLSRIPISSAALRRGQQSVPGREQLRSVDGADGGLFQGVGLVMSEEKLPELTELKQVPYQPQSGAKAVDTLVPVNMQSAIRQALEKLEQQVGNLDDYVAGCLRIESREDLYQRFSAEQIDGLALAYSNLAKGNSFIIGDQTGVGKGRMVAAILEYARQRDLIPIFVTEYDALYPDIFRDLYDIQSKDFNPLITNPGMRIELPDGTRLRTNSGESHKILIRSLLEHGDIGAYNAVFTTYSQLQTVRGKDTERRGLLRAIAPMSLLVLDESHNAGGTEQTGYQQASVLNRADFVREMVQRAAGVVYSSATYAKNPYVMSLYASRTGMRLAVDNPINLVGMIQDGGVPLQQVLAAKLTEAGQYIRRERSYAGIEFAAKIAPVDHPMAEKMATVMSRIMDFDRAKKGSIQGMDQELKREAKSLTVDNSVGEAGAKSTLFTSTMHNVISQSLLAMKAEATVQEALAALERGEKPVIALANTMGSVIGREATNQDLKPGDPIVLSVGDLLRRYLERSRDIQTKDYLGQTESRPLSDAELSGEALRLYEECANLINETDWTGVPVSPIDYIRQRLSQAGYVVDELTGRSERIEYGLNGEQYYQTRNDASGKNRTQLINGFNSGRVDVLILNRSSATGISLHASERFSDQRPRRMIIAQPELDINLFMQMLGRIHRTGQVEKPRFTFLMGDIPAEKRPAAILLKKMASLNANTTAARESGFNLESVPDLMNAYGDQVALELMFNRPDLHSKLGFPIKGLGEDPEQEMELEVISSGAINKVTGRIPLLPIAEQEEVYQLIEESYLALAEQEQAMGTSILQAETLDLDAQVLAKVEVFPTRGGEVNSFTEAVSLEVLDVKAQRKPMTTLQVINAVREELGLPPVLRISEHERESIPSLAQEKTAQMLQNLQERVQAYQHLYELRLRAASTGSEKESVESKVGKLAEKSRQQVERISGILQDYPIGQSVWVVNERTASTHYGVIQGYQNSGGSFQNPALPSSWTMLIQVADATRKLVMPLSKVNSGFQSGLRVDPVSQTLLEGKDIYALFDERQSLAREVRQVFTGNVIRAYEKFKGKLINFTDKQGQVRQGLMMPLAFELDKTLANQPVQIPIAEQGVAFMNQYRSEIQTIDALLSIRHVVRKNDFVIATQGRQSDSYVLDKDFLAVLGTEFYSVSDRMEAIVPADKIVASLEYLMDQKGISLVTHKYKEDARVFFGIELPKIGDLSYSNLVAEEPELLASTPVPGSKPNRDSEIIAAAVSSSDPVIAESQGEVSLSGWELRKVQLQALGFPNQYIDALYQAGLITEEGYGQRPLAQMQIAGAGTQSGFWFQMGKGAITRIMLTETPQEAIALAVQDRRVKEGVIYLAAGTLESVPQEMLQTFTQQQGKVCVAYTNHPSGEAKAWGVAQQIPSVERYRPQGEFGTTAANQESNGIGDWKQKAQALGRSEQYLARIADVIASGQELSPQAQAAYQKDSESYSNVSNSLWRWVSAARSIGKSGEYVQRIIAVAQGFHGESPIPLSQAAKLALEKDLNSQVANVQKHELQGVER